MLFFINFFYLHFTEVAQVCGILLLSQMFISVVEEKFRYVMETTENKKHDMTWKIR